MLATMVLAACSSDDTTEPVVKRGMVLKANVEDTDTRATLTDTEGKWKFAFATNDVVKVGNDKVDGYYTFTNKGTEFESTDAQPAAAKWYAYFPGETISLENQSGDFAAVANKYALAGATESATTGSDGLTVTMKAKAAVLCIVGVTKGESLDINVQTAEGYVSGLTAVKNSADFRVQTSTAKVTLLSKPDAGVYYVVVPAGVKLSVFNGSELIKATKAGGLTAGKYYTLTTHDTTGSAKNKLGDDIGWVQLWPGGPKFATQSVAEKLDWYEATKKDDEYVWGKNWRTPTVEEIYGEGKLYASYNKTTSLYDPVAGSPSFSVVTENGEDKLTFTGVQPGYTNNKLVLYNTLEGGWSYYHFWTSSEIDGYGRRFMIAAYTEYVTGFGPSDRDTKKQKFLVRPVLAE